VLQEQTWGASFDDVVSAALMRACQKIGGVAAGAFDAAGRLVGTVFGITGVHGGKPVHWSHLLAVASGWQDRGLGRRLKFYQRERVLDLGATLMHWTYDPLEARNAHLNLNRLGAYVDAYEHDLYGSGEASLLHRGLGTDRFVVDWHLVGARVDLAQRGRLPRLTERTTHAPVVNPGGEPGPLAEAPLVRVEIPASIQAVKAASLPDAVRWRASTRRAFDHYLPQGYEVSTFYRVPSVGRCFYALVLKA
jgi:predicted GNAT superfamily acetyltransferase